MIIAIKAVVNYQTIVFSIDQVQHNIERTQEHTDYINNFLTPYLTSEYAPYFLAHENNQLLEGERIIKIISQEPVSSGDIIEEIPTINKGVTAVTPSQSRQQFIKDLTSDIVRKR